MKVIVEEVPKFVKRIGDQTIAGSNNTLIILGTDRAKNGPATIEDGLGHPDADGEGKGTGTVHFIAGRKAEDPDLKEDKAFLYLTMKSDVDDNLDLGDIEEANNESPGAILKSDILRLVARKNIKLASNDDQKHYIFIGEEKTVIRVDDDTTITVEDKKITIKAKNNKIELDDGKFYVEVGSTKFTMDGDLTKIDSPKINLVGGCGEPLRNYFKKVNEAILKHNHMTSVGPGTQVESGVGPNDQSVTNALNQNFSDLESSWKML